MREPLSMPVLMDLLLRLNSVFTKHRADEIRTLTGGYFEALKDLDEELVKGAVDVAIKQEPRFPVPAKLREYAKEVAARTRVSLLPVPIPTAELSDVVCPLCGVKPRLAWLESTHYKTGETSQHKRYIAPCDAQRHPPGRGYVPFPPNFIDWAIE